MCIRDRNEKISLETLEFGLKVSQVVNIIQRKDEPLNCDNKLQLLMDDDSLKDEVYSLQIDVLENELNKLRAIRDNSTTPKAFDNNNESIETVKEQNKTLQTQLENTRQLLNNSTSNKDQYEEIVQTLLDKCELIVEANSILEIQENENVLLQELLQNRSLNEQVLEDLNVKLLEYIHSQEIELQQLLKSNTQLKKQLEIELANEDAQLEKIKDLETSVDKMYIARRSSSSVSSLTNEELLQFKTPRNSWLLTSPTSIKNLPGQQSETSINSKDSFQKFTTTTQGFQLNVVKTPNKRNDI